jgi:hypothetical protein
MKIRGSFVSNSSSSSFIVAFPHNVWYAKNIQNLLFKDEETFKAKYFDKSWDTYTVAEMIMVAKNTWDIVNANADRKDIQKIMLTEMCYGYTDKDTKSFDDFENEDAYYDYREKNNRKILNEFFERNRGKDIVMLCFGDDYGILSGAIEQGDVFKPVDHIRIYRR